MARRPALVGLRSGRGGRQAAEDRGRQHVSSRPGRRRGGRRGGGGPARHRGGADDRRSREGPWPQRHPSQRPARPGGPLHGRVDRRHPDPLPALSAVHHQHAPAGRQQSARHVDRPHDEDCPAALRGHRPARRGPRGPDHLHANRLDEPLAGGGRDGPPLPRTAARGGLRAREAPLLHQLQRKRPGGPRGDPAHRSRP